MKLAQILCITCAALLLQGGCATTDVQGILTPANAHIAASLVCSNTLAFAVSDADRVATANYIYAVAHGVRTLSGGKVPTPAELKQTVDLFSPDAGKYVQLASGLQIIYGGLYSRITGNPKLALAYLEAIAAGCEEAAAAWVHATPTPVPTP